MIFTQDESRLLCKHLPGKGQAVAELAQKERASILLLSDSHGAPTTIQNILYGLHTAEKGASPDAMIFCGDGMGDICSLLAKAEEDESFAALLPPVIGVVEGNMDTGEYELSSPATHERLTIRVPLTQTLCACGHKIFFTHGHRFSLYNGTQYLVQRAREEGANFAVYGHTHIARAETMLAMLTVNPGSCSAPRGGMPQSYAVLNLKRAAASSADLTFYRIAGRTGKPFLPKPPPFY